MKDEDSVKQFDGYVALTEKRWRKLTKKDREAYFDNPLVALTYQPKVLLAGRVLYEPRQLTLEVDNLEWVSRAARSDDTVDFMILNQSHRGKLFTPDGDSFLASNGVRLVSRDAPKWRYAWRPGDDYDELHVWGKDRHQDSCYCRCFLGDWLRVEKAVKEYNKRYGK